MKSKKFVGYVPKGETIRNTLYEFVISSGYMKKFGMGKTEREIRENYGIAVKRTITLTWHDEPCGKEKKVARKKKPAKKKTSKKSMY